MDLYKLKHIPTGLYYQPVKGSYGNGTNLSKRGKIYQTKANALIGNSNTITISISDKQYEKQKELFDSLGCYVYCGTHYIRCKKSDFQIEYI